MNALERAIAPDGPWSKNALRLVGDEMVDEHHQELYCSAEFKPLTGQDSTEPGFRYLVNLSKAEYVDLTLYRQFDGFFVHPLVILIIAEPHFGMRNFAHSLWIPFMGAWSGDHIQTFHELPKSKKLKELWSHTSG